jgi:hypothetical protein
MDRNDCGHAINPMLVEARCRARPTWLRGVIFGDHRVTARPARRSSLPTIGYRLRRRAGFACSIIEASSEGHGAKETAKDAHPSIPRSRSRVRRGGIWLTHLPFAGKVLALRAGAAC